MWAQIVITHDTFYDILVGGMMLYPLGFTLNF